jgi:hypothetical protein
MDRLKDFIATSFLFENLKALYTQAVRPLPIFCMALKEVWNPS